MFEFRRVYVILLSRYGGFIREVQSQDTVSRASLYKDFSSMSQVSN